MPRQKELRGLRDSRLEIRVVPLNESKELQSVRDSPTLHHWNCSPHTGLRFSLRRAELAALRMLSVKDGLNLERAIVGVLQLFFVPDLVGRVLLKSWM